MKTVSFSKTFQKGHDAVPEILEHVMKAIETDEHFPAGNLQHEPPDPQQLLKFKYCITVRKFYL